MANFYNKNNLLVFFKQVGLSRNIKQIDFEKNNWKIKLEDNSLKELDTDLKYKKIKFLP
jgi:hypothetical protein